MLDEHFGFAATVLCLDMSVDSNQAGPECAKSSPHIGMVPPTDTGWPRVSYNAWLRLLFRISPLCKAEFLTAFTITRDPSTNHR